MKIVNLTEHPISWDPKLRLPIIPPSGKTSRVFFEHAYDHDIDGYPAYREVAGWVKGLPNPKEDVSYIVSGIVFQSVLRPDVYTPNTQPWSVSHKQNGSVKSVKSLICHPKVIA
jgi:hypothetical protein